MTNRLALGITAAVIVIGGVSAGGEAPAVSGHVDQQLIIHLR